MQYQYILYLLGFGGLMGTVYDVYNTVSGSSRWLRWLRPLLDVVFWCLSAVMVYYITFLTDDGRFRVYTFALVLIGYLIYRILLHHTVVGSAFAVVRIFRVLLTAFGRLANALVLQPVRFVLAVIWSMAGQVYVLLYRLEDLGVWIAVFWLRLVFLPFRGSWKRWGQSFYNKFMDKWEGMWTDLSNWIRTWPQRN